MTPEVLFHQLLGLGDEWRVSRCEFDEQGGEVRLWVEELPHFWVVESARQKQAVRLYDHTGELEWRHLNVFEHRCVLRCSRDRRGDCKQVCIGLVCTPEGLPLSFEVFAGNRAGAGATARSSGVAIAQRRAPNRKCSAENHPLNRAKF